MDAYLKMLTFEIIKMGIYFAEGNIKKTCYFYVTLKNKKEIKIVFDNVTKENFPFREFPRTVNICQPMADTVLNSVGKAVIVCPATDCEFQQ